MSLSLTTKGIDKYFGYLMWLDNVSKKSLIIKLAESMDSKEDKKFDLRSLYGVWDDSRDSDEIVKEIRESRVDKLTIVDF